MISRVVGCDSTEPPSQPQFPPLTQSQLRSHSTSAPAAPPSPPPQPPSHSLTFASLNCNKSLSIRRSIILERCISLSASIIGLQDIGLIQVGEENDLAVWFADNGFKLIPKCWLPTGRSPEYSNRDILDLRKYHVTNGHHHRQNRDRIALLVSHSYCAVVETVYTGPAMPRIQCLRLNLPSQPLFIFNVYCPPSSHDVEEQQRVYSDITHTLDNLPRQRNLVVLGDFNATLNPLIDRSPPHSALSPYDLALHDFLGEQDLNDSFRLINGDLRSFSFSHNSSASRIDFVLLDSSLASAATHASIDAFFYEDHEVVAATVLIQPAILGPRSLPDTPSKRYRTVPLHKGKMPDIWVKFGLAANKAIARLPAIPEQPSAENLSQATQQFISSLQDAAASTFGLQTKRHDQRPHASQGLSRLLSVLNTTNKHICFIRSLRPLPIASKRAAFQQKIPILAAFLHVDHIPNWGYAYTKLQRKRRELKCAIQRLYDSEVRTKMTQYEAYKASVDGKARGFSQYSPKISSNAPVSAVLRPDGSLAVRPDDVLTAVRESYQSLFGVTHPLPQWTEQEPPPWSPFDQPLPPLDERYDLSPPAIREFLQGARLNGAPDIHGLQMAMFYCLDGSSLQHLSSLLLGIVSTNSIPLPCCLTPMFLIHKGNSPLQLNNYRSISLLNTILKVLDGMFNQSATLLLDSSGRLSPMQWLFRPHRGVREALGIFDQTLDHFHRHQANTPLFVGQFDIYKAFDTVHPDLLVERISRIGLPLLSQHIARMYGTLSVIIKTTHGFTVPMPYRQGVFQGAPSSPGVYAIYVNPLNLMLNAGPGVVIRPRCAGDPPCPSSVSCKVAAVSAADDLVTFDKNFPNARETVLRVCQFGYFNNQRVNIGKSDFYTSSKLPLHLLQLAIPRPWLSPCNSTASHVTVPFRGPDFSFRYLGIHRSLNDRSSAHVAHLDGIIYSCLSQVLRKRVNGPFASTIANALIYSVVRFAAPFVTFPTAVVQRWESVITRVMKKSQGLSSRLPNILFYCHLATGLRSLSEEIAMERLSTYAALTSTFHSVTKVFICNDADMARNGNGAPPLYTIAQAFPWLRNSMVGDIWRICQDALLLASWSSGPLCAPNGHATLFRFTGKDLPNQAPAMINKDRVLPIHHVQGAIATPRNMFWRFPVSPALFIRTSACIVSQDGSLKSRHAAFLDGTLTQMGGLRPIHIDAWNSWIGTFAINNRLPSHLPLSSTPSLRSYFNPPLLFPLAPRLIRVALLASSFFQNHATRGVQTGGGVAVCTSPAFCISVGTPSSQSVQHSIALSLLVTISKIDRQQDVLFSCPVETLADQLEHWSSYPTTTQAQHPFRTTMEHLFDAINAHRGSLGITVNPTGDLSNFDPLITPDLINPNPDYWIHGESPGSLRLLAQAAAIGPRALPRLRPQTTRLMWTSRTSQEWIEGPMGPFLGRLFDQRRLSSLASHHTLGTYFSVEAHPLCVSMWLHHPQRSLIWKARANCCGTGDNLVRWGIIDVNDPVSRCSCCHSDPNAPLESLSHMLFECPHQSDLRSQLLLPPAIQHQASLPFALGLILENGIRPNSELLRHAVARAKSNVTTFIKMWTRRISLNQRPG